MSFRFVVSHQEADVVSVWSPFWIRYTLTASAVAGASLVANTHGSQQVVCEEPVCVSQILKQVGSAQSEDPICVPLSSHGADSKDEDSTCFSLQPDFRIEDSISGFQISDEDSICVPEIAQHVDLTVVSQSSRQESSTCSSRIEGLSPQGLYKAFLDQTFESYIEENAGHPVDDPLGLEFSSLTDLLALSAVATCSFYFVQPVSRYRLSSDTNRRLARTSNVDIVRVGRSALYVCRCCSTKYFAQVPALVCACFLCGTCGDTLPKFASNFHNARPCACEAC